LGFAAVSISLRPLRFGRIRRDQARFGQRNRAAAQTWSCRDAAPAQHHRKRLGSIKRDHRNHTKAVEAMRVEPTPRPRL